MVRFIITYSVVGTVGSLMVFFSVPLLKTPTPPPPVQVAQSSKESQSAREQREKDLAAAKAEMDREDAAAAEEAMKDAAQAKEMAEKKARIPSLKKYHAEIVRYLKMKEWETALKVIAKGLEHYPENETLLRLKEKAQERGRTWGSVWVANAPIYNISGKRQKTLPVGALVDIRDQKKTKTRSLYICNIIDNGGTIKDVLINTSHVTIADGLLENKSDEERDLLVKKASIKAKIYELEKALKEDQEKSNPHAAAYKKARDAYTAFSKKVNQLVKMRDEESDTDKRMEYGDQLRLMQSEGLQLKTAYDQSKAAFDKYNSNKVTATSPEIQKLKKEVTSISLQLR